MVTHTQGQWRFQNNAEFWQTNPYSVTVRAPGVHSVTIANCPSRAKIPQAQARANALLIAAAPDLLAALEQCLPLIDAYRRNSGGDGDLSAMNARTAIKKARGKQ